ncbi:uncharacterized protein C8Q71DRAFT_704762 [Rhodofomes roseus]|uniref:NAD(P)-binding protein n=1 Tax=Rhodofomes roseus TaxID=34475 RepID=A0ABQ8KKC4_9APHY|nr:uncharacterized protein C8Q71DRAFT_704762 [Rhodofomes roseus]KAH9838353.1 hypothetical protein C8Q71DRAFT_704762 [Rhodofomes roseus]
MSLGAGSASVLALALAVLFVSRRLLRRSARATKVSKRDERVLILGASSGIGRALAHEYARRGARVCVTARRTDELKKVVEECSALQETRGASAKETRALSVAADFTNVDEMVHLRDVLERDWSGVDTVIVCAGVSALRPLMEVAGLERDGRSFTPSQATAEGLKHTVDVARKAVNVNYLGPLVSAVALLPLLQNTSQSPSILLISSLAALVPAPTRTLYGSTKAASLMLYQSLSIEHPTVAFTFAVPATVRGGFRASAVDGGPVREANPDTHGLRLEDVAARCVRAVDDGEKFVWMPYVFGRFGQLGYWLVPRLVERLAGRKYNFTA